MSNSPFNSIQSDLANGGGVAQMFDRLAEQFRSQKRYHDLFDTRLMQSRCRLGLPLEHSPQLDELAEPLRTQTEEAYIRACNEVGRMLLKEGQLREAWMYLRPVGAKQTMAHNLVKIEPNDDNVEELVDLALHEGIAPAFGYRLVLDFFGVCNAVTMFESVMAAQPQAEQKAAAEMLVRRIHGELLANVQAHVEDKEGKVPSETTLAELVADRDWLTADENYHIDTSHLAAAVRFSRLLEAPEAVRLALDLTEYGRRLSPSLQPADDEPFVDLYPAHGLLLAATMGERVGEALEYFSQRAREVDSKEHGAGAVETYLILLRRLGRQAEALEVAAELAPAGQRLSPYAPTLLELARQCGRIDRYLEICRQREDLLAFAAGLADQQG